MTAETQSELEGLADVFAARAHASYPHASTPEIKCDEKRGESNAWAEAAKYLRLRIQHATQPETNTTQDDLDYTPSPLHNPENSAGC